MVLSNGISLKFNKNEGSHVAYQISQMIMIIWTLSI